ncbi:MAG: hypothetical protein JKY48_18090 [Flavobacteriales bacterium]|nr:hypothetical protein [Flavobacteriales bacterium]
MLFYLTSDGEPEITLAYDFPDIQTQPEAWLFPYYFPTLSNTVYDTVALATTPIPQFIFSSISYTDTTLESGNEIGLSSGLNFYGTIMPQGTTFEILEVILGSLDDMAMTGPITNYSYGPKMNLSVNLDKIISTLFPSNDLPATLDLYSEFNNEDGYFNAGLVLGVTFSLGNTESLTASITFSGASTSWITINGDFDNVSIPSATELIEWIGGEGNDLTLLLPSDLQGADAIYFDSLIFSFLSMTPDLSYVGFSLMAAEGQGWELIPDWFTLKDITGKFDVYNPFVSANRSSSATLEGTINIPSDNPVLQVTAGTNLSGSRIWASLVENTEFNLIELISRFIPAVSDVPSIIFDQLEFYVEMDDSPTYYQFIAHTQSSLSYNFGGSTMVGIEQFSLNLSNGGESNEVLGSMGATIILFDSNFAATYNINEGFKIDGQLATFTVDLRDFSLGLSGYDFDFPSWLPTLTFSNTELYVSEQSGSTSSFDFSLRTQLIISGLSDPILLSFESLENEGVWGFTAGLDIDLPKLSDFPGLSSLAPFDSVFQLKQMQMIIATADFPNYTFPSADEFSNPSLNTQTIQLPVSQSGLQEGLYVYVSADLDTSSSIAMMQKFLDLQVTVDASMFIGEDPEQDAKLMISIPELVIQSGIVISGSFGGIIQTGLIALYMDGTLTASVQGQPLTFDLLLLVVENGGFLSGTMDGTISFETFKLSNLVLEIGIDLEGIPSFGIAATIDYGTIDSSFAIFFDSTDPANSMVAGAISDTTIDQLYDAILGQVVSLPSGFENILAQVGISGTNDFNIDSSLSYNLDNLQISEVSTAFSEQGVSIPTDQTSVLLVVSQTGELWYLTDLTNMKHYSLVMEDSAIKVSYEAQFYCVPMTTILGSYTYQAGFFVTGMISFFGLTASLTFTIDTQKGMAADVYFSSFHIWNTSFFNVSDADGNSGPYLSMSTYTQPSLAVPYQDPHFIISAKINLMGLTSTTYLYVTESNINFELQTTIKSIISYDLSGYYTDLNNVSISGEADVELDVTLDLGTLGTCPFNSKVSTSMDISYSSDTMDIPTTNAQGSFEFNGIGFTIPLFGLEVEDQALYNYDISITEQVTDIILAYLGDYTVWLQWIDDGLILGMSVAEDVGEVLSDTFMIGYNTIGSSTQEILNYSSTQVADALDGAGATADEATQVMSDLGYSVDQIDDAIESAYEGVHSDVNLGHADIPAVHTDAQTVPHTDSSTPHSDTNITPHSDEKISSHSDSKVFGIHSDIPAIHSDIPAVHSDIPQVHEDTPSVHTDTNITPHSDSNEHVDINT